MASSDAPKLPLVLHQLAIPYILLTAALTIPQRRQVVAAVFLPLLWTSYSHLLQTSSPSPPVGFVVGSFVVFHALFSLNLLLLRDPRREFQRAAEPHVYPDDNLLRRIGWVLDLVSTMRGVGWNWGVRSLPRDDAATLRVFLWRRVKHLLLLWAWLDATMFWMQQVDAAYFLPEGNLYDSGKGVVVVVYAGLFAASARHGEAVSAPRGFPEIPRDGVRRVLYVCALHAWRTGLQGVTVYTAMDGVYTELAVVCSAVGGLADAVWPGAARLPWLDWRCWPDLFGGWAHGDWGHGLAELWGGAWHGLFKSVRLNTYIYPHHHLLQTANNPPRRPSPPPPATYVGYCSSRPALPPPSHSGSSRHSLCPPYSTTPARTRSPRTDGAAHASSCCSRSGSFSSASSCTCTGGVRYAGRRTCGPSAGWCSQARRSSTRCGTAECGRCSQCP